MRRARLGIRLLFSTLLGLTGCYSTNRIIVKAPPREEQFTLPPDGDQRYCSAPQFPKGTLNQDKQKDNFDPNKGGGMGGMGGGGMGGMGGGGMGGMGGGGMGGMR